MLVLARKLREAIIIEHPGLPGPIRISIVDIDRGTIRLAIAADRSVAIDREEIALRKKGGTDAAKEAA